PSLGLFVSGSFGSYTPGFYLASALLLAAAWLALLVFRDGDHRGRVADHRTRGARAGGFVQAVRAPVFRAMLLVAFVQMMGVWLLPLAGRGNLLVLGVAALLLGGSYAVSSPAWLALMSETAPRGSTGMAMGASETAQGAGLIIGPLLGGFLYDHVGPQAPFV